MVQTAKLFWLSVDDLGDQILANIQEIIASKHSAEDSLEKSSETSFINFRPSEIPSSSTPNSSFQDFEKWTITSSTEVL